MSAYADTQFFLAPNFVGGLIDTGGTFQGITYPSRFNIPGLSGPKLINGASGAGKINLISKLYQGTAAAAPVDFDLTNLLDKDGNLIDFIRVKGLVTVNFASAAGFDLLLGGAASNAFAAPFNGSATAKMVLPAGFTDSTSGITYLNADVRMNGSATGWATSGTSKVWQIDPGANSVPYWFFAVGNDV